MLLFETACIIRWHNISADEICNKEQNRTPGDLSCYPASKSRSEKSLVLAFIC